MSCLDLVEVFQVYFVHFVLNKNLVATSIYIYKKNISYTNDNIMLCIFKFRLTMCFYQPITLSNY